MQVPIGPLDMFEWLSVLILAVILLGLLGANGLRLRNFYHRARAAGSPPAR